MRRTVFLTAVVAVLAAFVLGVSVIGAEKEQAGQKMQGQAMGMGQMGSQMKGMSEKDMMAGDQKAMKEMGMSEQMMMRRKMLMGMTVKPGDPQAVLALKDDLKLTDQQVQQLQGIAEKARAEAMKVLNEMQSTELAKLGDAPESVVGMCKMMTDEGKPGMMPMHSGMMKGDTMQGGSMMKGEGSGTKAEGMMKEGQGKAKTEAMERLEEKAQ